MSAKQNIIGGIAAIGVMASPLVIEEVKTRNEDTAQEELVYTDENTSNYDKKFGMMTLLMDSGGGGGNLGEGGFGDGSFGHWDGQYYTDPNSQMVLSSKAIKLILHFEAGFNKDGTPSGYTRKFERAVYPGYASGATIGIGYDLGYKTRSEIARDWGPYATPGQLAALQNAVGKKRSASKPYVNAINATGFTSRIDTIAQQIFMKTTLAKWCRLTSNAFPNVEKLHPHCQGAMVSLCFNRGSGVNGRKYMLQKRNAIKSGNLNAVPGIFRNSSSKWAGSSVYTGLKRRRYAEGALFAEGLALSPGMTPGPYMHTMPERQSTAIVGIGSVQGPPPPSSVPTGAPDANTATTTPTE